MNRERRLPRPRPACKRPVGVPDVDLTFSQDEFSNVFARFQKYNLVVRLDLDPASGTALWKQIMDGLDTAIGEHYDVPTPPSAATTSSDPFSASNFVFLKHGRAKAGNRYPMESADRVASNVDKLFLVSGELSNQGRKIVHFHMPGDTTSSSLVICVGKCLYPCVVFDLISSAIQQLLVLET